MSYYFISIGGSGAKVMESITHLCVAGILPDKDKLKIFAIDPDMGNGNLERTSAALNNFNVFQQLEVGIDSILFKNKMSIIEPFPWNPAEHSKTLDELIAYPTYSGKPIGDLFEMLYTRKERGLKLNEGFRGHPSIGAAVLAQKYTQLNNNDKNWNNLTKQIMQDIGSGEKVKIFIAGSVFGGTGAAGLPTVARLLRDEFEDYDNVVAIGGVLILPYFKFTPVNTGNQLFAHSENFLTNTKAALKYYAQKDNIFNVMYFVGDSVMTKVDNFSVGASNQRNDAHIVDFYAALAAVDFYQQDINNNHYFKYICHNENDKFDWNDFPQIYESGANFRNLFVKFVRFIFAYIHLIKPVRKDLIAGKLPAYQYPWFIDYLQGVDLNEMVIKNFDDYAESFVNWLKQIESLEMRNISLIDSQMFEANPARLNDTDKFKSCDGIDTNLSLHEIWYRMSEKKDIDSNASGYGKFLRCLYESCE